MHISIEECRALIPNGDHMTDAEVETLRAEMRTLADAMLGIWVRLDTMDQATLNPPGDVIDQLGSEEAGQPWNN